MQRIKDEFVVDLNRYLPLQGLSVLDVGCGNGERSAKLAGLCATLTGIDPDVKTIDEAVKREIPGATFSVGLAGGLKFADDSFDVVIYAKSLHHVAADKMNKAIAEAVRVVRPAGHIVFLELVDKGTFHETKRLFDTKGAACKGTLALATIVAHSGLRIVKEWADEAIYKFDSADDFTEFFAPKKNLDQIDSFVTKHDFLLNDLRRSSSLNHNNQRKERVCLKSR